jgi:rod shape determining protein RodA
MLAIQVFINVAMVLGMIPIVGIPLPLLSYGGSSLLATMLSLGLLLNIHMRRFMY